LNEGVVKDSTYKLLSFILAVVIAIGMFLRWYLDRNKPVPSVVISPAIAAPSPAVEPPAAAVSPRRKQKPAVLASGLASTAIGEQKIQGDCNAVSNGGIGNTATANCVPPERHLTEEQKIALKGLRIPDSVKVVVVMIADGESQTFGHEIVSVLTLPPRQWEIAEFTDGPPIGGYVRIHDLNEPLEEQQLAMQMATILGIPAHHGTNTSAGELDIVVGRAPHQQK
jgi:hypothetical protein